MIHSTLLLVILAQPASVDPPDEVPVVRPESQDNEASRDAWHRTLQRRLADLERRVTLYESRARRRAVALREGLPEPVRTTIAELATLRQVARDALEDAMDAPLEIWEAHKAPATAAVEGLEEAVMRAARP